MIASQQCHARGYACAKLLLALALGIAWTAANAADPVDQECDQAEVLAHVQEQFRIYGPRSDRLEFFGFIYRENGVIASSVVRGDLCNGHEGCEVDIRPAARRIPHGAKVLGEWHTHPHFLAAEFLSKDDVRGARNNAHIRCYTAYYASSNGAFYAWDPRSTSVPTAMASRTKLGNYRKPLESSSPPLVAGAAH